YPEGVKGYRLWDRSQKGVKIIISKDVTFNENEIPCIKGKTEPESEVESESEYIATTEVIKEALWLRGVLHELCVLNDYV
ncbi:retrovirus-related Pol poly from transposon TNT 1-94, partial [Olea europaea subsp. europaea]